MNKTDLKERISLSEKFPLIKIMGGKEQRKPQIKDRRVTKKHVRSLTSKVDNGDLAQCNPPGLAAVCYIGRLGGAVWS